MEKRSCYEEWKPVFAIITANVAFGVMDAFVKKSLDHGLNALVLITHRQFIATIVLAPIAYFKEMRSRPKLTRWVLVCIFFNALLGGWVMQYMFFIGMRYTSVTFACAFINMVPVFTFLVALPFRLERLNLSSIAGKAKVAATVGCLAGAMVLTFYRGIALTHPTQALSAADHHSPANTVDNKIMKWTISSLLLLGSAFSWSAWFLIQSKITENYPPIYSGTTLMFFISFFQAVAFAFATKRDTSIWVLKGKLEIITVVYSGVVGSGISTLITSWCVCKRGPVFAAAFSPTIQVVVAIIDFSVLREPLYLGSVLGSLLVVFGLYVILWAKRKEAESCAVEPVGGSGKDSGGGGRQIEVLTA